MKTIVHYLPCDTAKTWTLHAWTEDGKAWDLKGVASGGAFDFELPESIDDLRKVQFKFRATDSNHTEQWEKEDFVRHIRLANAAEMWCFPYSPRVLYRDPFPPGITFRAGDALTLRVITKERFKGGQIYVWNACNPTQVARFIETERDDSASTSTFAVKLEEWMTQGFHFKLVRGNGNGADWESDSANRVWRPCDGASVWIKSGQVNVRRVDPVTLPQRVSEEVERFLWYTTDAYLLLVNFQFQLLHHLCHLCWCLPRLSTAQDHKVVGVVDNVGL